MSENQDAEVKRLRIKLRVVTEQRDLLLLRARQAVFQGLSDDRPYRLLAGEPLRALSYLEQFERLKQRAVLERELGLKIDDFGADPEWTRRVRDYHTFLQELMVNGNIQNFVHSREFV